jgi:hypothetical protein
MLIEAMTAFERRLCRRNRILGGGIGRGAKPPAEGVKELVRSLREEGKAI